MLWGMRRHIYILLRESTTIHMQPEAVFYAFKHGRGGEAVALTYVINKRKIVDVLKVWNMSLKS